MNSTTTFLNTYRRSRTLQTSSNTSQMIHLSAKMHANINHSRTSFGQTSRQHTRDQSYMRTIQHNNITKYDLLRIILEGTDEDPNVTKHLKTRMYFTRSLAGENQTTQKYQTTATVLHLILQVLAHPTPPCHAPEIPATNPTVTILAIAKALTPCQCTSSGGTTHQTTPPHSTDHICQSCNHLKFKDTPTTDQPTQQYYSTCAVCQESHDIPYENPHPCQPCIILGLLAQRRTIEWWPQHTTYIHPTQESHHPLDLTPTTASAANFPQGVF